MKKLSCRNYKSLGPFNMLTVKGVSEAVFFKEWSNRVFHSLQFLKESSYDNHLFSQNVEYLRQIPEIEQKNQQKFFVSKIIAFESETTNIHNPEQDTCHWQSMCYKSPLRFSNSLRQIFSKSYYLRVMKKYDESALMQILQEFGTL